MRTFLSRGSRVALAAVAALALTASVVDARVGGGRNSGSRGSQTFQAPAGTNLAPKGGQTVNRSVTQPGQQAVQRQAAPGAATAAQPSRFGFGSGLMAGLLGAGLVGMLFGGGFLSGLSGLGSMLGLLLQVALIGGLIYLAVRFFRRRAEPSYANGPGMARSPLDDGQRRGLGNLGLGGGFGAAGAATQPQVDAPLAIEQRDYETFERLLADIQTASSHEDVGTIRRLCTPEMASYIEGDIADNQSKGLVNEISEVKFLDGDLAEAWRDPDADYATVAMRFRIADVTKEKATGRIVDGSTTPVEITEIWTFRREPGDDWKLSAIQQPA